MYNILFADDDVAIGFLISKYHCWNESDFQLKRVVTSGEKALEALRQESYDLLITDIRMPGMDGLELIHEMRKQHLNTSVLLCSTYTDFQYAREGMRLGALDYIEKPLTEKKLCEALQFSEQFLERQKKDNPGQRQLSSEIGSRKQSQFFESIWSLDERSEELLTEIIEELEKKYEEEEGDKEKEKIAEILKVCYTEFMNQILSKFPWLKKFNGITIEIRPDHYGEDAKEILQKTKEFIKKFQVFHGDQVIASICSIIAENLQNDGVADVVSEKLDLSSDYIRVLFRNKTGVQFNRYLMLLKMEYAKQRLKSTNLKIYEISHECGYETIDYFTRLFKEYEGLTPVQYRKKVQNTRNFMENIKTVM